MNLAQAIERNRGVGPGFHFLRHALSFLIIAHHTRVAIRGVEASSIYKGAVLTAGVTQHLTYGEIVIEVMRPGLFALVGMFFALSGFLVTGSALRNPTVSTFFANRALRILPALSIEVTLAALLLGPLVTTMALSDYFTDYGFWRYFGNIVGHVTFALPGVFKSNPWTGIVNANMWTLAPEFWCYLLTLTLMGTGLILKRRVLTIAILLLAAGLSILFLVNPHLTIRENATHFTEWYIVVMFFYGMLAHVAADKIPMSRLLFLGCGALYYVMTLLNVAGPLSGLPLNYCTVYLGFMTFPWFDRLMKHDLSYGMYLYAFPITQTVVLLVLPILAGLGMGVQFAVIFPVVMVLTLGFSLVSWLYIEKPALKLKKYTTSFVKARAPQAPVPVSVAADAAAQKDEEGGGTPATI